MSGFLEVHSERYNANAPRSITILARVYNSQPYCPVYPQISGRGWKQPGTRAGALKNPHLATSWEKKMQNKAEAKLFKEQKTAASDEHKAKLAVRRQGSGLF